ncbi:hypothetical protein VmeM32_00020 [Vibrio phage vB_VmeM-32]|nr:hypothetical protein VmeM32_00020 [Vibrio phage vB_VmeM-32]
MKLYDQLRTDLLAYRKMGAKIESKLLQYVIGNLEQIRSPKTDEMVINFIKKLKKDLIKANLVEVDLNRSAEIDLLRTYLPKELSLDDAIKIITSNGFNINEQRGTIMQFTKSFCQNSGILFNGSTVNKAIEQLKFYK